MKPLLIKLSLSFFIVSNFFIPAFTSRAYVVQAKQSTTEILAKKPMTLTPVSPRLFDIEVDKIMDLSF